MLNEEPWFEKQKGIGEELGHWLRFYQVVLYVLSVGGMMKYGHYISCIVGLAFLEWIISENTTLELEKKPKIGLK